MTVTNYLYALVCVIALAAGQVLFKAAAIASKGSSGFLAFKPMAYLSIAIAIYAVASIFWVWILRNEELGRIYPFMALAFVLVPLGSRLFFGESFQATYYAGLVLIIVGLFLTTRP